MIGLILVGVVAVLSGAENPLPFSIDRKGYALEGGADKPAALESVQIFQPGYDPDFLLPRLDQGDVTRTQRWGQRGPRSVCVAAPDDMGCLGHAAQEGWRSIVGRTNLSGSVRFDLVGWGRAAVPKHDVQINLPSDHKGHEGGFLQGQVSAVLSDVRGAVLNEGKENQERPQARQPSGSVSGIGRFFLRYQVEAFVFIGLGLAFCAALGLSICLNDGNAKRRLLWAPVALLSGGGATLFYGLAINGGVAG